jgi:hypothetical protein
LKYKEKVVSPNRQSNLPTASAVASMAGESYHVESSEP